jgi:hypothetical protein
VPPGELPHELEAGMPHIGEYHYIDLDSHGAAGAGHRVLVLLDDRKTPPASWQELPHLMDAETKLGHAQHARHLELLSDVGAKASHGGYALAKHLASIHPSFRP